MKDEMNDEGEAVEIPIDGVLDLHTFRPAEARDLIVHYLEACRERGILLVRIIHGKGTGQMRRTVHTLLGSLPGVRSFRLAEPDAGGFGATVAELWPEGRDEGD